MDESTSQKPSPPSSRSSSTSSRDSTSPPPLQHNFFAPPFYNRPPTPLPPSPSLTSLLRPSRPTTPESSDAEGAGAHHTGVRSSSATSASALAAGAAARAPAPRTPPLVPTYEYYGFALYLFSSAAFLGYILWAYVPSRVLHAVGVHYYPNRWWALAIPAWLVVVVIWIYVALASWNTSYLTLRAADVGTIVDGKGNVMRRGGGGSQGSSLMGRDAEVKVRCRSRTSSWAKDGEDGWRSSWFEGTDAVMDVPLGGVCQVLYGGRGRSRAGSLAGHAGVEA